MKKHIFMILIISILFSFAACGNHNGAEEDVLTVWMLNDTAQMREMLDTYQTVNPDVQLQIEIGVPDYDTTVTDALKKLNTRLLGGEGPDVLILDDVNVQPYIEAGVLAELKGLDLDALPAGIKANITKDGNVYCVPTHLALPMNMQASHLDVDFTNLQQFNEDVKSQRLNVTYFENLSSLWYKTAMEPKLIANKGADIKVMQSFFKELMDLMKYVLKDEEYFFASYQQVNMQVNPLSLFSKIYHGELDCGKEYVASMMDLQIICSMMEKKEIKAEICRTGNDCMYIPMGQVAINANSRKQKDAKKLVAYLLSKEGQLDFAGIGGAEVIPVNKEALKEAMKESDVIRITYGNLGEYETPPFSAERSAWVMEQMDALKYEAATDGKLMEIVMLGAQSYLNGETTLENAAADTCQKMELYFNE